MEETDLQFFSPEIGERLLTNEESQQLEAAARQQEAEARHREAEARHLAEQEVERLRAELRMLKAKHGSQDETS